MEEKIKVLLVDDDVQLGTSVKDELNRCGNYKVEYLNSALGVFQAIDAFQPDVLVFDVEIGDANGIDMAVQLYNGNPERPLIFISSNHTDEMQIKGVATAGAMVYLTKPFSTQLLAAHIDNFVRKKQIEHSAEEDVTVKQFGNLTVDYRNRALLYENDKIKVLNPMEFAVFKELTGNFEQTVSREELMKAMWKGNEAYYNEQSLNNCISRMRRYIEKNTNLRLTVVRQMGYQLIPN